LQQVEKLAAIGLRKEKGAAAFDRQKEEDEETLRQALQHRFEQRKVKERLEAVRAEKARLDSLAVFNQPFGLSSLYILLYIVYSQHYIRMDVSC
jgi:hypothetical protein